MSRQCKECGKVFFPKRDDDVYCCFECSYDAAFRDDEDDGSEDVRCSALTMSGAKCRARAKNNGLCSTHLRMSFDLEEGFDL